MVFTHDYIYVSFSNPKHINVKKHLPFTNLDIRWTKKTIIYLSLPSPEIAAFEPPRHRYLRNIEEPLVSRPERKGF